VPAAARITDQHTCPAWTPLPHFGGPILPPGVPTVLIGSQPAAVMGSTCTCMFSAPDVIVKASTTVQIGSRGAARMGDQTAHGGVIVAGCPTVLIGG
jgi:uncharacterized Zn-binding protein involved in type VI secretion